MEFAMFLSKIHSDTRRLALVLGVVTSPIFVSPLFCRADLIELINGDHYLGTVVSMSTSNVEFLSEIQGRVTLPRAKVAQITMHEVTPKPAPATNQFSAAPLAGATAPF